VSISAFSIRCRCCACAARLQLNQQLCRSKVIEGIQVLRRCHHQKPLPPSPRGLLPSKVNPRAVPRTSQKRASPSTSSFPVQAALTKAPRPQRARPHSLLHADCCWPVKSTLPDRYRLLRSPVRPQPQLRAPLGPRPLFDLDVCALLIASQ
jgi:hypothetical protein